MSQPVPPPIQGQDIVLPRIHVHDISPVSYPAVFLAPRGGDSLPEKRRETATTRVDYSDPEARANQSSKRSAEYVGLENGKRQRQQRQLDASRRSVMAAGATASRPGPYAAAKKQCTSPRRTGRASAKDIDWADVTDPEERRRIQNRIAQRKFREKARENQEKAERESQNHEHAGNSYRIPLGAADTGCGYGHGYGYNQQEELSGLPWGGMNLSVVVSRGHEAESRRSSRRGTYVGDESLTGSTSSRYVVTPGPAPIGTGLYRGYARQQGPQHQHQALTSYDSSGGMVHSFFEDATGYI